MSECNDTYVAFGGGGPLVWRVVAMILGSDGVCRVVVVMFNLSSDVDRGAFRTLVQP